MSVARINGKWRVGDSGNLANSLSHHRRLINPANAHVDIEDLRTRLDLIKSIALDAEQRAFANLRRQFLSARRVNAFANQRRRLLVNGYCL